MYIYIYIHTIIWYIQIRYWNFPVESWYPPVIKDGNGADSRGTLCQVVVSSPSDDDIKEIPGMRSGIGAVMIYVYGFV